MKILSLELKGYKRLALNNINYFKLDLVSSVQLILGTNGSGKSSILQELSPLPADKANFRKGGSKKIVVLHNDKTYTLLSSFENGQHHSFLVDGQELNDGRTVTIQKELVKEHFGLTQDFHELMLGMEKFSSMSPARRREWLTRFCVVDYTYALKLYKRVQERLNIASGALKHAKKRLAIEATKVIDAEEAKIVEQRLNELNNEAQALYRFRDMDQPSVDNVRESIHDVIANITRWTNEYRSIRKSIGADCYFTPQEMEEDANEILSTINQLKGRYQQLSEQFMQLQSETPEGDELDTQELLELRERISQTKKRQLELLDMRVEKIEFSRPRLARDAMAGVYADIVSAISELPINKDSRYSINNLNAFIDQAKALDILIREQDSKLNTAHHELQRMESLLKGEEHQCPKCEHKWVSGYNETVHQRLISNVKVFGEKLAELKAKQAQLQEKIQEQQDYYNKRTYVHNIFRSCAELKPLWESLSTSGVLNEDPMQAQLMIERVRNDIDLMVTAEELGEVCLNDMRKLEYAELTQTAGFKAKREQMRHLEQEIGHVSAAINLHQNRYDNVRNTLRSLNRMEAIRDALRSGADQLGQLQESVVRSIKNELIDSSLVDVHAEISALSSKMNQITAQQRLIDDIRSQIETLSEEEKAIKLLQKSLSPVDGLIAEGMLGFIRQFVARMNIFIAQVWSYSMEVKDCSLEEDSAELNYKFPVYMAEVGETIPDVSRGSAGMVEMIDLAFRIAAAQCMGLDTGPLALDEFGKTFDDAHREAATRVVAQMMENLAFSQLFMVSHYETSWGAFYKAQVTVVDKRNITLPAHIEYNKHTLIKS